MEALWFAEESKRGFVFSCSAYNGEKIVTGADSLLSNVAKSGAEASRIKNIPNTKRSK